MKWYARVGSDNDYGRWVPTGCTDKAKAEDYMSTYYNVYRVKEWLLL